MKSNPMFRVAATAVAFSALALVTVPLHAETGKEKKAVQAEVSVMGRVKYPGRFRVTAESTLADVLKKAGGLTAEANGVVKVTRMNPDGARQDWELDAVKDAAFRLEAGDIVFSAPSK